VESEKEYPVSFNGKCFMGRLGFKDQIEEIIIGRTKEE
jgi:hypothetical protein